jgi:hypothetical protein
MIERSDRKNKLYAESGREGLSFGFFHFFSRRPGFSSENSFRDEEGFGLSFWVELETVWVGTRERRSAPSSDEV